MEVFDIHCVKAIIDIIIFLEHSSEEVIDPDISVSTLENFAYELSLMDNAHKRDFINKVKILSNQYESNMQDFVKNIPTHLGILP